ncbi:MAG: endonuclease III [Desulfitobacteriaceae bacterium]
MENRLSHFEISRILNILAETYPEAHCELNFTTPFQLLIATMLSAQSTDKKVNTVTEKLFAHCQTPEDFLILGQFGLEQAIKELGLFHNKARNILATCSTMLDRYGGQVPQALEELISLPGVGRKTASVVSSNAFGLPAFAVDTHVFRVSNRIGLANSSQVNKVEDQLKLAIAKEKWSLAHHWLIWHGRRLCTARKPACHSCPINLYCYSFKTGSSLQRKAKRPN